MKNKVIYQYHFSYYGITDREWVNSFQNNYENSFA